MKSKFSNHLSRIVEDQDQDDRLIFDRVKKLLDQYVKEDVTFDNTISLGDVFKNHIALADLIDDHSKIDSGFENMDLSHSFRKGEYVVIGGRPAMGKTQFLVNLAMNMSVDVPVLFLSFDLSDSAIIKRMIANLTGIPFERLLRGELNALETKFVMSMEEEFTERKLLINDKSYSNVSYVKNLCKIYVEKEGVKVIIVDYLQLLGGDRFKGNREAEISYVSRTLKSIARENDVLVIASSQLSRAVENRGGDKRPHLSDLRESGAIEQDADKVFFIYRPEYYGFMMDEDGFSNQGICKLILAKNRSGHLGEFTFKMDENFTRLMSVEDQLEQFIINEDRMKDLDDLDDSIF